MKITNHHELRKRHTIHVGKTKKTDQSYKKMCCINTIVSNYNKTGILSHQSKKIAQYMDNTQIPSLMDAHELLRDAKDAFLTLPSNIRKLMDHDPKNLIKFVQNPENYDMLLKHGIIEERKEVKEPLKVEPSTKADPPKTESAAVKSQEV